MICPKCGKEQPDSDACTGCHIIIGKYFKYLEKKQSARPSAPVAPPDAVQNKNRQSANASTDKTSPPSPSQPAAMLSQEEILADLRKHAEQSPYTFRTTGDDDETVRLLRARGLKKLKERQTVGTVELRTPEEIAADTERHRRTNPLRYAPLDVQQKINERLHARWDEEDRIAKRKLTAFYAIASLFAVYYGSLVLKYCFELLLGEHRAAGLVRFVVFISTPFSWSWGRLGPDVLFLVTVFCALRFGPVRHAAADYRGSKALSLYAQMFLIHFFANLLAIYSMGGSISPALGEILKYPISLSGMYLVMRSMSGTAEWFARAVTMGGVQASTPSEDRIQWIVLGLLSVLVVVFGLYAYRDHAAAGYEGSRSREEKILTLMSSIGGETAKSDPDMDQVEQCEDKLNALTGPLGPFPQVRSGNGMPPLPMEERIRHLDTILSHYAGLTIDECWSCYENGREKAVNNIIRKYGQYVGTPTSAIRDLYYGNFREYRTVQDVIERASHQGKWYLVVHLQYVPPDKIK